MTGHMFGYGCYFGEYSKALQYSTARFGGTQNKLNKYSFNLPGDTDYKKGKRNIKRNLIRKQKKLTRISVNYRKLLTVSNMEIAKNLTLL